MSSKNFLLSICAVFLLFAPQLEAKFLITYGDSIATVAQLDQEIKDYFGLEVDDIELSYRYEQFGIFWLEIWSWSGDFCIYSAQENKYWTLPEESRTYIASKIPNAFTVPMAYKFPTGLIIIVIGAVALFAFSRQGGKEQAEMPGEGENAQA